jgi:hypothetical protein
MWYRNQLILVKFEDSLRPYQGIEQFSVVSRDIIPDSYGAPEIQVSQNAVFYFAVNEPSAYRAEVALH